MSVFSDFEMFKDMWRTRFPGQRLSDAWEEMLKQDVQASLTRHSKKIADLKKELETEQLYVEYLQRLLSDVEKYREDSECNSPPAKDSPDAQPTEEKSVTELKTVNINNNNNNTSANKSNGSTTSPDTTNVDDKPKEDSLVHLRQHDPINQCINELTSNLNLRRCFSEINEKTTNITDNKLRETIEEESKSRRVSQNDVAAATSSPSHFVTVIEVKESEAPPTKPTHTPAAANVNAAGDEAVTVVSSVAGVRSAIGSYENVIIEKKSTVASVAQKFNSAHKENVIKEEKEQCDEPNVSSFKMGPSNVAGDDKKISAASISLADIRKKVPPRPPPKFPRRAAANFIEPPTVPSNASPPSRRSIDKVATSSSTSSSLERNIKPSELFRQKSSDSLDIKLAAINNRKTEPVDMSKFSKSSDLAGEFEKKLAKSESMKSNQSSTGSLSGVTASPTGSLDKASHAKSHVMTSSSSNNNDSPTGSLDKASCKANISAGSRESLASGGIIDGRIKSYESISSLSSDSIKVSGGGGGSVGGHHQGNEPYYDTVPLDNNGDGEYVYIQAGGNGSSSSRDDISMAGSTLPLPRPRSQTSVHVTEPESPGRSPNYANLNYFLQHSQKVRTSSADSDNELDAAPPPLYRAISVDSESSRMGEGGGGVNSSGLTRSVSNASRKKIILQIISSIENSETLYVECLNKMWQYKKAIYATLTTSQPVISEEDFNTIFFKIEDLHDVHGKFLEELRQKQKSADTSGTSDLLVGDIFKRLTSHVHLYGAFLHNYGRAIDTVKKCGAHSDQFKKIVSKIVLHSQNEQSLSLEDLLHKPVARVQKNALNLQDLLNHTPENHADYQSLKIAQKTIRNLFSEFNVVQAKSMFPNDDKALRRLVKNSFIVELVDGHRKLRHLFLFNDVIACAKYKACGRDRFEFELKWFIALKDIIICEESAIDPKEANPVNIVQLKSQACNVRDQIMLDDRQDKKSRTGDKHRKKLADLEGQLVLASPNLVFKICNRGNGKYMTFFLSSDFERTQWIESILTLQQSCNLPGASPVHIYELQAWITACQALIKTEMGSYLMRNARDESLLVGDLQLTIQGLTGLEQPADLFICIEVDSYGHYFRKAKTKLVCRSANPVWNESFVLELEGSQNLRVLLYQDDPLRPILRARQVVKLSRHWLQERPADKPLKLSETVTLNTSIRFIPGSETLSRVPTSKPGALFGAKLQAVLKREKRDVPFLISACIREVERRGMCEVGIYRVSGSASDLAKLKKSFETNSYEAEQLLKEVDIHSVTGILKSYLRELPEALFTDAMYGKFVEAFNQRSHTTESQRGEGLMVYFNDLPAQNKATIHLILDHLMKVHQQEAENKMSLHNLAMVFGPTLLRPGQSSKQQKELLESSTVDVMAQAGILYCFLQNRLK